MFDIFSFLVNELVSCYRNFLFDIFLFLVFHNITYKCPSYDFYIFVQLKECCLENSLDILL